jgi:hypothetical protein
MSKKTTPTLLEQVLANRPSAQPGVPPTLLPERNQVADLPDQLYTAAINQPVMPLHYQSIRPDPGQARWVLPGLIRVKYLNSQVDAPGAMREWIDYVDRLVARTKTKKARAEVAEAVELDKIAALAQSIKLGGQIEPITVVQTDSGWQIETGERRFWAHIYLIVAEPALSDTTVTIPATKQKRIDPFRQAIENQFRDGLSAIAVGREIVRLLIEAQDAPAAWHNGQPTLADYRQMAAMDLRGALPDKVTQVLQMSEESLYRYKKLLLLPDAALEIADRHRLTEGQLRPVLTVAGDKARNQIVALMAELRLTVKEVEGLCRQPNLDAAERELRMKRAGKKTSSKLGASIRLYHQCLGVERAVNQTLKAGDSPARLLAQQYLSQKGKEAPASLRALSKILAEAAREAEQGARGGKRRRK